MRFVWFNSFFGHFPQSVVSGGDEEASRGRRGCGSNWEAWSWAWRPQFAQRLGQEQGLEFFIDFVNLVDIAQKNAQLVNLLEVSFLSNTIVSKVDQEKERERERLDERRGRREVNIRKRVEGYLEPVQHPPLLLGKGKKHWRAGPSGNEKSGRTFQEDDCRPRHILEAAQWRGDSGQDWREEQEGRRGKESKVSFIGNHC